MLQSFPGCGGQSTILDMLRLSGMQHFALYEQDSAGLAREQWGQTDVVVIPVEGVQDAPL
eukprot:SAG31_NODE_32634_length_353_cov_0.870079_2_plen_59_part_01